MIDAEILAHFGAVVSLRPTPPFDPARQRLEALADRRSQLVNLINEDANRLGVCPDAWMKTEIQRHLTWLKKSVRKLEKKIDSYAQSVPSLARTMEILQAQPGVGPVVSARLTASLPELGRLNRKEIAALAGVAPLRIVAWPIAVTVGA